MSEQDDREWFDALRGANPAGGSAAQEGERLRAAILAEGEPTTRSEAQRNADLQALEARLEDEGLLPPLHTTTSGADATSDERAEAAQPGSAVPSHFKWAMAATLALVAIAVPLMWNAWQVQNEILGQPMPVLRDIAPAVVTVDHPRVEAKRLARLLIRADAEASVYEASGQWRVDALLPVPVSIKAEQALKRYGIPPPADGRVKVVFHDRAE